MGSRIWVPQVTVFYLGLGSLVLARWPVRWMGSRTRPARRGIPLPPSSGHDFNRAGKGPAQNSPQTPPFPLRRSIFHPPVPRLLLAAGGRRAPFLGFGCPRLRFSTWVLGLLSWLPGRRSPVAGRFFTPLARHPPPQAANPRPTLNTTRVGHPPIQPRGELHQWYPNECCVPQTNQGNSLRATRPGPTAFQKLRSYLDWI